MDIVIKGEDGEQTVPLDSVALPEGYAVVPTKDYVSRESVKEDYVHQAELQRRFKNWTPRDKAAEDESVIAEVLSKHGQTTDLEAAKNQWREGELNPALDRLHGLQNQLKAEEVRAEAGRLFDERFTTSPIAGSPSWAETAMGGLFKFDEDLGYTVAIDATEKPILSSEPTKNRPYMGVRERLAQVASDPSFAPYLKEPPKNDSGSGFVSKSTGVSAPSSRSNLTAAQKADFVSKNGVEAYMALPK